MARKVFFSFHFAPDSWRASQVRQMGVVEGNQPCSDNDWESVTNGGDPAIAKWISGQMAGKSCTVVLIGAHTAGRKWIQYEIEKSWNGKKGLVGIHIHNLKNADGDQSTKGRNPFNDFTIGDQKVKLSSIVKSYDPPFALSTKVYDYIQTHIADWIEEAIEIRASY